jgi:hypothetical protein
VYCCVVVFSVYVYILKSYLASDLQIMLLDPEKAEEVITMFIQVEYVLELSVFQHVWLCLW